MWVRSQDKRGLFDVKGCFIVDECPWKEDECEIAGICESSAECKLWSLGTYKAKEKAMSVLDDLQCRIARTESGVYQMPEDEE